MANQERALIARQRLSTKKPQRDGCDIRSSADDDDRTWMIKWKMNDAVNLNDRQREAYMIYPCDEVFLNRDSRGVVRLCTETSRLIRRLLAKLVARLPPYCGRHDWILLLQGLLTNTTVYIALHHLST